MSACVRAWCNAVSATEAIFYREQFQAIVYRERFQASLSHKEERIHRLTTGLQRLDI